MSNYLPPIKRMLDADGNPVAGGKLNFYETGTTTPLATYSDKALSVPNANPVVADADGYVGRIFLQDELYTIVATDADDNTLWTEDDVEGVYLVNPDLETRLGQVASNPLDYGAIGDGAADETSEVQDAIDNAEVVVDLLGKTFRCDSTIYPTSNKVIKNGTIDCSNNTGVGVSIAGTAGTPAALTADCAYENEVSIASTSGYSAGDLVYLFQTASAPSRAQLATISEVVDGTTLNFDRTTVIELPSANPSYIVKLTPIDNVIFENVTFLGSSSSGAIAVLANTVTRVTFRNCKFSGSYYGCGIVRTDVAVFEDCEFSDYTTGMFIANGSCSTKVSHSRFKGSVSGGTPSGNGILIAEDPTSSGYIYACDKTRIVDCEFSRQGYGVRAYEYGTDCILGSVDIENCRFDPMVTRAIRIEGNDDNIEFVNIRRCTCYEEILLDKIGSGSIIDGCTVYGAGIDVTVSALGDEWLGTAFVTNNNCNANNASHGVVTVAGQWCVVMGNVCASTSVTSTIDEVVANNITDP